MARRRHKSSEEETSYWLSYSDMLAALLLIFVLIISSTMLQSKRQYEIKEQELEEQQILIEQQREQMLSQQTQLEEQQEQMLSQQAQLEEQQEQMLGQQTQLETQQAQMEEQQIKLDKIIGVRGELISALKQEFDGSALHVFVDGQTGAITFDSSVLFDLDKSDIKESGDTFLKEFLPRYFSVLLDREFKEYIAEIIIEGHTDTSADYMYNLKLSQNRALAVAKYCLDEQKNFLTDSEVAALQKIVTANGRSYSDPVFNEDNTVNMEASRRVEFKFRLKDEEMIQEMNAILNDSNTNAE